MEFMRNRNDERRKDEMRVVWSVERGQCVVRHYPPPPPPPTMIGISVVRALELDKI